MLYLGTIRIKGLSHSVHLGISFLMEHKLKLICTEEDVALMPLKDGSASRARLVDGGCHNFISTRTGTVLKATEDQRISEQVWRTPHKKLSINTLNERPEEAEVCMQRRTVRFLWEMGNTSQYR